MSRNIDVFHHHMFIICINYILQKPQVEGQQNVSVLQSEFKKVISSKSSLMKSEIQFKFSISFPVSSACLVYGLWPLCDACGYVYLICPYCLFLLQRYLFRSTPVHHPWAFNSLSNKQPFVMDWELEDKFTFIYPTQKSRTTHTHTQPSNV